MRRLKEKMRQLDPWLLGPYLILCAIGIVMVYSASAAIRMQTGGSPTAYLLKQTIYVLMGVSGALLIANMNLNVFRDARLLGYSALALLGSLIFVKGFGAAVNGAQGWINLGIISIQPAEVVKFYLVIYLANHFANYDEHPQASHQHMYTRPALLTGALLFLIVIQPDTGGMAINAAIAFVIFLAGATAWKIGSLILSSALAIVMIGLPLASNWIIDHWSGSYKAARFVAYLNPFGTKNGAGAQLVNSYYAISNGGLTGAGLGNSIQKMGYLPEPNTDFILAVIAEELGFVAVALILVLLAILVCRIIILGARTNEMYEGLLCYGVATFLAVETAFNVGGVSGLLPITGVTLPFISYGGSSMLVLSASIGLILNVSRRQKERAALAKLEGEMAHV